MSSTFGFPTVPNTLAASRAVTTSYATVTTTTTATVLETVRTTAYSTLTATATAARTPAGLVKSKIPPALLKNATAAYTAVHHQALQAGTAKYTLAEQLPVLKWVLLGAVGTGAGAYVIRKFRKRKPPVPIPVGKDAKKWQMMARGVTAWLQQALRTNAGLRQDLARAKQAEMDAHQTVDHAQQTAEFAQQAAEHRLQKMRDELSAELRGARQQVKDQDEEILELRQHIQHAEELEKMQDEEIAASRERADEFQRKLNEAIKRRKQLEEAAAQAGLSKPEVTNVSTSASRLPNRDTPGIDASPPQVPSSIDRPSASRQQATAGMDDVTLNHSVRPSLRSSIPIGTPIPWAPLGNVYRSSDKRRVTPKQSYGGVYGSVQRILERDALIENTPTNQRKRAWGDDGNEETRKPAKLRRSSPLEDHNDPTYTPKETPPASLSFGSKGKQKVNGSADTRLWGLDGLPSIKIEPSESLQAYVEPEDFTSDITMTDSDESDNSMADNPVETIEPPADVGPSRGPSRMSSRLPVASNASPARRSARAAARNVPSLNERDLANRSTSPEKDDREDALRTVGRKRQSKTPAEDSTKGNARSPTRKLALNSPEKIGGTSSTRQTRSMSPDKGLKKNGQRISKPLASPKKK